MLSNCLTHITDCLFVFGLQKRPPAMSNDVKWPSSSEQLTEYLSDGIAQLEAERDALAAEVTKWERSWRDVHEPALREAHAYIQDLRAELDAIKGQPRQSEGGQDE